MLILVLFLMIIYVGNVLVVIVKNEEKVSFMMIEN